MIVQVYVASEDQLAKGQGFKLGQYYGGVPLGVSIDFIDNENLLPGKWVTIIDQSKKPIVLSEIRVFGSKWKYLFLINTDSISWGHITNIAKGTMDPEIDCFNQINNSNKSLTALTPVASCDSFDGFYKPALRAVTCCQQFWQLLKAGSLNIMQNLQWVQGVKIWYNVPIFPPNFTINASSVPFHANFMLLNDLQNTRQFPT